MFSCISQERCPPVTLARNLASACLARRGSRHCWVFQVSGNASREVVPLGVCMRALPQRYRNANASLSAVRLVALLLGTV